MKNKSKFSNQARALVTSYVPLRLRYFMGLVSLAYRGFTNSGIGKAIVNELNKASESYPALGRYTQLLKGLSLHKLNALGFFSTFSSHKDDDESEEALSSMDRNVWYPFRPIPNIRTFEVQLSGFDGVFAMFGIRNRFAPLMKFNKFENHKLNYYMAHQLRRLEDARVGKNLVVRASDGSDITIEEITKAAERGEILHKTVRIAPNPILYFRICDSLIKHSTVFFAGQLSQTEPHGHRSIPFGKVKGGFKRYLVQSKNMFMRLNYHRTFIPKPNDKFRPLGVPTIPGRIQLGLGNKFLLKFLKGKIGASQHAYQPLKGTISAGRELVKVLNYRNIYSYDLSKYFDKVSLNACVHRLEEHGVPALGAKGFCGIHLSFPMNISDHPFEPIASKSMPQWEAYKAMNLKVSELVAYRDELIKERLEGTTGTFEQIFSLNPLLEHNYGTETLLKDNYHTTDEIAASYGIDKHGVVSTGNDKKGGNQARFGNKTRYLFPTQAHDIGVPQGAPISPLLAVLAQEVRMDSLNTSNVPGKESKLIKYSDDGLKVSNDDKNAALIDDPESGIYESKEKSYGVKREGKGLAPLEFLGLAYDGIKDQLKAHTRSGSQLVFNKDALVDYINFRELVGRPECNRHDRLGKGKPMWVDSKDRSKGLTHHEGVCSKALGDPIDCPCPTLCEMGLNPKLKHEGDPRGSIGGKSGRDMVSNKVFGLIQSRLYQGTGNLDDFQQDFRLTFNKGSGIAGPGKYGRKLEDVNVFTSTSFALFSLVQILKFVRKGEKYTTLQNGHTFSTSSLKEIKRKADKEAARILEEQMNGFEDTEDPHFDYQQNPRFYESRILDVENDFDSGGEPIYTSKRLPTKFMGYFGGNGTIYAISKGYYHPGMDSLEIKVNTRELGKEHAKGGNLFKAFSGLKPDLTYFLSYIPATILILGIKLPAIRVIRQDTGLDYIAVSCLYLLFNVLLLYVIQPGPCAILTL